ncbi:ATP-binding protein [Methylocella sp. CPCC 101449]|uniref:ATP-binding protein n=1 Tax=Methylocella sp. CPCC 101449 TaxID=2987531 RepID=UPI00288F924F|nr:ATP-binding protein [Methylocella sp. CPCC 101449]MDT2023311.1 ATP-binding protein [Methylocella sp. CPCC 101449]
MTKFKFPGLPKRSDLIVLTLAFVALEWISEIHEHKGLHVTAWSPGIGLLFGIMFRNLTAGSVSMLVSIMLAETIFIDRAPGWPMIGVVAAVTTASYAGASLVARRYFDFNPSLARIGDIAVLLGSGLVASALTSSLVTGTFLMSDNITVSDIPYVTIPLLISELIGVGVVTPLVLRWPKIKATLFDRKPSPSDLSAPIIAIATGLLIGLVLKTFPMVGTSYFYLLFLPVIAVALIYGIDGACMTLACVQVAFVADASLAGSSPDDSLFSVYQSGMIVLTATALLIGSIVTERDAAAHAAADAAEKLKEAERGAARADRFHLVSGMTSTLAHEISQPLTAARALARTAAVRSEQESAIDPSRLQDNLRGVVQNIDTAGEILRRMREFLKRGEPEKSEADMRDIIADAMALQRPLIAQQGIVVEQPRFAGPLRLQCDRIQIQQIVMNLVANSVDAINSTGRTDGRIRIAATLLDDPARIEVLVQDNGSGIDPSASERLFEPLFTSRANGLGLGLAVCANIAQAHAGRIWLERSKPGDTEFRFWLPADQSGDDT